METVPRLLAVMGSGETSPTMVRTHRDLLDRLGPAPVPAVVLDTPFGFQANAADLAARAVAYFRGSVGRPMEVASYPASGGDPLAYETMLARLRAARYVFSGPGSPTYALRQWRGTEVPELLAGKLRHGGCITFASAAALTLGVTTVPVYEIYKAGEAPRWLEGLDLLAEVGLRAAVIPHYNNAEGGTHDTLFCYLGEKRLSLMEEQLPSGAFVLGVDEHTALVLDLDAGTASVTGLGVVTVRRRGESAEVGAGVTVTIDELAALAGPAARSASGTGQDGTGQPAVSASASRGAAASPLLERVAELQAVFDAAVETEDVDGAVRAVLELEEELSSWAHDSLQSDEADRGRVSLRAMVVGLGVLAGTNAQPLSATVAPFVEALLKQRDDSRRAGRFEEADALRDLLVSLGFEVRDDQGATTWRLVT